MWGEGPLLDRQHVGGVDDLTRDIDWHVADDLAAFFSVLPFLDSGEIVVLEQGFAALDDFLGAGHGYLLLHFAARLAMKASSPSTASSVDITPSR